MAGDEEPKSVALLTAAGGDAADSEPDGDVGNESADDLANRLRQNMMECVSGGRAREIHTGQYVVRPGCMAPFGSPGGEVQFTMVGQHEDVQRRTLSAALRRNVRSAATTSAGMLLLGAVLLVVALATGALPMSAVMAPVQKDPVGDAMVKAAAHCFLQCGGKSGRCDHFCGAGNSCCYYGQNSSAECRGVEHWSTKLWHTCVRAGGQQGGAEDNIALPVMDLAATLTTPREQAALKKARAEVPLRRAQDVGYRDSIHDPDVDIAECDIDAFQAIASLGAAGTGISAATRVCRTPWRQSWTKNYGTRVAIPTDAQADSTSQSTCGASLMDVTSAFIYAAAFLSDAATMCAMGYITQAQCAMDITYFIASFGEVANAATTMTQVCLPGLQKKHFRNRDNPNVPVDAFDGAYGRRLHANATEEDEAPKNLRSSQRRLEEESTTDTTTRFVQDPETFVYKVAGVVMSKKDQIQSQQNIITECVFDADEAALFAARAGVFIERARRDCPDPDTDGCAVDVEFILNAFGFVGSFMAYSVNHCGQFANIGSLCGSAVTNMVAALDGIAAAGTDFRRSCELFNPMAPQYDPGAEGESEAAAADAAAATPPPPPPPGVPPYSPPSPDDRPYEPPSQPPAAPPQPPPEQPPAAPPQPPQERPPPQPPSTVDPEKPDEPPPATPVERPPPPPPVDISGVEPDERPNPQPPAVVQDPFRSNVTSGSIVRRGPKYTFYVYRGQKAADAPSWHLANSNGANLAGTMWYLQHEVVSSTPRKFGIDSIFRYKVEYMPPQQLVDAGMKFGVRFAYDFGKCTGPGDCQARYDQYGYFAGCNKLGDFPYPQFETYYRGGVWYSFPKEGHCRSLSDDPACTYTVERAGHISLAELEGSAGTFEGGSPGTFWADPHNSEANTRKVQAARGLFQSKYPEDPEYLNAPACDFNYGKFYQGTPDFR